ncbi:hypothetical protein ACMAZF_04565 [Psychrobium sp. nBUS_13]|uniref:hypothetical protein n=1 Tax=Psychrobium sp. nBUS_13 TaxID=3395319 RepID=UPI003EBAAAAD
MKNVVIILLLPVLSNCTMLNQNSLNNQTYTRFFTCENAEKTKREKFVVTSRAEISDTDINIQIENTLDKDKMHYYKCVVETTK